jgi:phosphate:Na+ symporter
MADLQKGYQRLKSSMLQAGTDGRIPVRQMVDHLDTLSNIRRMAEQVEKGARYLTAIRAATEEEKTHERETKEILAQTGKS